MGARLTLRLRLRLRLRVGALLLFGGSLAAAATLVALPVHAGEPDSCGGHASAILRQAYPAARSSGATTLTVPAGTITLPDPDAMVTSAQDVICRIWPARPDLMLVAVPVMARQSEDENAGDLDLLVVDSRDFAVQQRLRLPGLMNDDAIRLSGLRFDTARYRLSPEDIAFGLRLDWEGSSRPNPFSQSALFLFSLADGGLRPVLQGLIVDENRGEWDTTCAGTFERTERTLSMVPSKAKGIADIQVDEVKTTTVNRRETKGDCSATEDSRSAQFRLTSTGGIYGVPKALRMSGLN